MLKQTRFANLPRWNIDENIDDGGILIAPSDCVEFWDVLDNFCFDIFSLKQTLIDKFEMISNLSATSPAALSIGNTPLLIWIFRDTLLDTFGKYIGKGRLQLFFLFRFKTNSMLILW